MFGFAASIGGSLDAALSFASLGDSLTSKTADLTVPIAVLNRPHRETDRYSKLDQQPIPIDTIPIRVSNAVRELRFSPFVYTRLSSGEERGPYIRLIEILPAGAVADHVWCKVHVRRLHETGPFEALSYTWGRLARDVPVFVSSGNGAANEDTNEALPHALLVTPQLYATLKRLRREKDSRMMWIDQCCINQSDNEEKGEQVQLMGEIYQTADRTVIWLGESDEHAGVVQELVTALEQQSLADESHADCGAVRKLIDVANKADAASQRRLQALTRLLNRDWFTRVWVFQEAVLSRNLVVRCGQFEFAFDLLRRLAEAVSDLEYTLGGYAHSLPSTTVGFGMINLIQHCRSTCRHARCQITQSGDFLGLLLQVLLQCRATDDHDLVYAFLAFQNWKGKDKIKPDYALDIGKAWTQAAYTIVSNTECLDVLCAASAGLRPGLPSWVPDWTACFRFGRPISAPDMRSSFHAAGVTKHVWQEPSEPDRLTGKLRVRGQIIDTIAWLSPWNSESRYYKDVNLEEFINLAGHKDSVTKYLGTQSRLSATQIQERFPDLEGDLLRTILADGAFGTKQPLLADSLGIIKAYRGGDPAQTSSVMDSYEELQECSLILQKKRLFVSGNLELGLAPRDAEGAGARVGDVIALLDGSKTPCVLREGVEEDNQYIAVGQCYMRNWMFEENRGGRASGVKETFVLI